MNPQVSAATTAARRAQHSRVVGICLALAAITFAVFGQTIGHQFVNFDDGDYVLKNAVVRQGVTLQGVAWAFSGSHFANWHPVTWLSHMLDCQLYGLDPGAHHLTNVVLHIGTVIALFLVLLRMTGAQWRSAFVAAVFAIHPLRAESVAWVSERKDVLSGLFFMLTLLAYERYARGNPRSETRGPKVLADGHRRSAEAEMSAAKDAKSSGFREICGSGAFWYFVTLAFFALGLMSKPMLVTLPLVLLLLDFWPLQRTKPTVRLVLEKVPFLALSAVSCL